MTWKLKRDFASFFHIYKDFKDQKWRGNWKYEEGGGGCNVSSFKNNCEHGHFDFQKGVHFRKDNKHGLVFHFKNTHDVWKCKKIFLIVTNPKTTNVERFFDFWFFSTRFFNQKIPKDDKHKKTTMLILTNHIGHFNTIGKTIWTLSFLLT